MSLESLESSLRLIIEKLQEAEMIDPNPPNQLIEFFKKNRAIFAAMLTNQDPQYASLVCLAYDRLVIDFLLERKIAFPLSEISLEECLYGTARSLSVFTKNAEAVKNGASRALLRSYLTIAAFVLNSNSTNQDIMNLRRELASKYKYGSTPDVAIAINKDKLYKVEQSMAPYIKQLLIWGIVLLVGYFLFRGHQIILYILRGVQI